MEEGWKVWVERNWKGEDRVNRTLEIRATGPWLMGLVAYPNWQGEPDPGDEGNRTMGTRSSWTPMATWHGENKLGSTRPWVLVRLEELDSVWLLSRGSRPLCVELNSSSAWSDCLLCGSEGRVRRIIWQTERAKLNRTEVAIGSDRGSGASIRSSDSVPLNSNGYLDAWQALVGYGGEPDQRGMVQTPRSRASTPVRLPLCEA
jgi:hypothetical protein